MTDLNNTDTAPEGDGVPAGTEPAAAPVTPDELATLKSRNSGLNAKVTELQKQLDAERAGRTAAEQAAAGKAGTDDVLNKRIAELEAALAENAKKTAIAEKGAKYPESYGLVGDGIENLAPDVLAAMEARLLGAKDAGEPETPKPVGNNPQRGAGTGAKNIEDMNSKELFAYMKSLKPSDMGLGS